MNTYNFVPQTDQIVTQTSCQASEHSKPTGPDCGAHETPIADALRVDNLEELQQITRSLFFLVQV